MDHEGGYWFSTLNSGIYYIKNPSISVFNIKNKKRSSHVNTLAKKNDHLLVGYKNGDFADISPNSSYTLLEAPVINVPTIVEYDSIHKKTYFFLNQKILVDGNFKVGGYKTKLSEPYKFNNVFAAFNSGFYDINKNTYNYLPYRIHDVCLWENDTILATPNGIFKKQNNKAIALNIDSKLLGYRSDDIDISTKGDRLFIATQGAGVVVYEKKIYNISKKEGLSSNIINEIYVENDSVIWACTNKGLNRIIFRDNTYHISALNKNDGLLSNEVEDVEVINDMLWVGTKEGLCYMSKSTLDNKVLNSDYLKINEVKVNDIVYCDNESPKLNYDENKITFSVEAISYSKNNDLEYAYRLKEVDKSWSITKNRIISFPNLKHGSYTFQISACINNKCFKDNQLEYRFTIKPPFWRSWWFYMLCVLVFVGLVYLFFKIRVLTYNKDVTREFMRLLIKRLKRNEKFLIIRMNGEDVKVNTIDILYIKSSGNYLDIVTATKTYTMRCKIGDFIQLTPDALEYVRVHRSYIIRIDKVTGKSKKTVTINTETIPVGETYIHEVDKIQF